MDVSFRAIVEDDFQTVCDLLPSEEELFLVYAQGKYPLTIPQVGRLVETRMEPTVMLHRGRVVGFGDFYNYRAGRSVFVGNIVIDQSERGKGLGKRLVCHMIDRAFSGHDLPSVRIHVYNRNLRALLLYSALGFSPYAMKVNRDYKGDPVLLLSLRLSRDAWPCR
jgi:ribosomal protein S18 acetylase RimI-like enzyme